MGEIIVKPAIHTENTNKKIWVIFIYGLLNLHLKTLTQQNIISTGIDNGTPKSPTMQNALDCNINDKITKSKNFCILPKDRIKHNTKKI